MRCSAGLAAAGVVGLVVSSCSLAFDLGRQQCDSTADCEESGLSGAVCEDQVCVSRADPVGSTAATTTSGAGGAGSSSSSSGTGGEDDPRWACLGSFEEPEPDPDSTIVYPFRIELATSAGNPPDELAIRLCATLDTLCASPIDDAPQPDEDGAFELELAPSFQGFFEVTATDLMPTIVFLPRLVVLPPTQQVIRVVRVTEFNAIVTSSGQDYDETRGTAIVLTEDCQQERVAGVVLSTANADENTIPYYFKGLIPDFDATQTDDQAAGGWVNLPTGFITAEARRVETDQFIGIAGFQSRAGTLSYVPIGPTPEP